MVELYRLYRLKSDLDKVVVVRDIEKGQVTILHALPLSSDICWLAPPKRETLSLVDFEELYCPYLGEKS